MIHVVDGGGRRAAAGGHVLPGDPEIADRRLLGGGSDVDDRAEIVRASLPPVGGAARSVANSRDAGYSSVSISTRLRSPSSSRAAGRPVTSTAALLTAGTRFSGWMMAPQTFASGSVACQRARCRLPERRTRRSRFDDSGGFATGRLAGVQSRRQHALAAGSLTAVLAAPGISRASFLGRQRAGAERSRQKIAPEQVGMTLEVDDDRDRFLNPCCSSSAFGAAFRLAHAVIRLLRPARG